MFNSTLEIIKAYQSGEMVILMDDEKRENEGDLLAPASMITAQQINFMATHARGLICLTLTSADCQKLNLPNMVGRANDANSTNFTVSIEAAEGVSTGISAHDRAATIQAAVRVNAKPEDVTTPGHIFPLRARDGGVLVRAGHTEAGCDLAMLAGMPSHSSVIVEIMNEDGSMARLADLQNFAQKHSLKLGTIADLISFRLENECLIESVGVNCLTGYLADFCCHRFYDSVDDLYHYALVKGEIGEQCHTEVWTRVHVQDYFDDLLGCIAGSKVEIAADDNHWRLSEAIEFVRQQESGVVVILASPTQIAQAGQHHDDSRTFGKGAQILRLLNVQRIGVLGSQARYDGISGFGIEVTQFLTKKPKRT